MIVIKEKRGRLGVRERGGEDRMGRRAKVDRREDQEGSEEGREVGRGERGKKIDHQRRGVEAGKIKQKREPC